MGGNRNCKPGFVANPLPTALTKLVIAEKRTPLTYRTTPHSNNLNTSLPPPLTHTHTLLQRTKTSKARQNMAENNTLSSSTSVHSCGSSTTSSSSSSSSSSSNKKSLSVVTFGSVYTRECERTVLLDSSKNTYLALSWGYHDLDATSVDEAEQKKITADSSSISAKQRRRKAKNLTQFERFEVLGKYAGYSQADINESWKVQLQKQQLAEEKLQRHQQQQQEQYQNEKHSKSLSPKKKSRIGKLGENVHKMQRATMSFAKKNIIKTTVRIR